MPYDDNQLGRDIQGIGGASAAYNRGALALAALRSTVGDAKFREIEKTWVQEHQEQTVTIAEFLKFASGKSGIDLSDWSKTWLYGTEKPSAWPTEATAPTTDPKPEATVTSLSVDATRLKKTEYRAGEQFDPTGLKITATYSDKSTKAIDPTDEAVTYHYDFAKPSGAAKSTVTYNGQTTSFTVKVTADAGNKTGNNPKQQASPAQNGNAVAVLATSMMTVVIASFWDRLLPSCGAGGSQVSCDALAQYRQGIRALPDWRSWADVQAWWPAYSVPKAALTAAIVFALTQYGSVLFVRTMIREYGKRSYLVASWVWHTALAITGFAVNMWLGVVTVVLLTRSVAIPLRFRGQRRTKPMIAGVTEAMCLLLVFIAVIIICPHLA